MIKNVTVQVTKGRVDGRLSEKGERVKQNKQIKNPHKRRQKYDGYQTERGWGR